MNRDDFSVPLTAEIGQGCVDDAQGAVVVGFELIADLVDGGVFHSTGYTVSGIADDGVKTAFGPVYLIDVGLDGVLVINVHYDRDDVRAFRGLPAAGSGIYFNAFGCEERCCCRSDSAAPSGKKDYFAP